ncbi:MAG: hypothetical protein IPJ30_23020 [Acidobacteria bacterium]|nr:hypothetical protein [Acidobacteriota bacterium]
MNSLRTIFVSDSSWQKIESVEETEPLGQKIYNADPDPLPDPSYDNSVGNADYPQWQCQMPSKFYGNFYAMPWHCQYAEIKRRSFEGGHYVIEEPETNPNKVSGHTTGSAGPATPTGSAGHEARHIMAFSRLMNFTLGATRKSTKETGEHTGDDDDPIRVKTHTSRIIGNRGERGSGIGKPLETGWAEPSGSGFDWKTKMTPEEIEEIRRVVLQRIEEIPMCGVFIERLGLQLTGKEMSAADFLNEAINRTKNTLGFSWGKYGERYGGVAYFSKTSGNAEIVLENKDRSMNPLNVFGLIHEILHIAFLAADQEISEVLKVLQIDVTLDRGETMKYPEDLDNRNLAYSQYFGQAVKNRCGDSSIGAEPRPPAYPITLLKGDR